MCFPMLAGRYFLNGGGGVGISEFLKRVNCFCLNCKPERPLNVLISLPTKIRLELISR